MSNEVIKESLASAKTIAMVGVSSVKEEISTAIKRRPSIIVMKYLQEFGYKVIPVNPTAAGTKICDEIAVAKLEDISIPVDVVNVFRPSKEAVTIAKQAVNIKAKIFWLQYGIQSEEAEKIIKSANILYIANKCIKQEYQKFFLKTNPVFPVLQ